MNCYCGGAEAPHKTGEGSCFREKVLVRPRKVSGNNAKWFVDGQSVEEYTLIHQRMYHQHPCGNWSRPKGGVSENSLTGF